MFIFDMPSDQLATCQLPQTKAPDFDAYWQRHLDRSGTQPNALFREPMAYPVEEVLVEAISLAAYDGGRISGFHITPREIRKRPTLVFFHGYSGHKKSVAHYLMWALQGYTCIAIDVRGQAGDSTDGAVYEGGHGLGWLTKGLDHPDTCYLMRTYIDAVRTVDAAVQLESVDPNFIGATGCSQGGGLSLAVCSLDARLRLCMSEVPAFCHFQRTLEVTQAGPWTEFSAYFRERPERLQRSMQTLSYVELNNLVERIDCPVLMDVGHQDLICVPSSIYSAFNRIVHPTKQLEVFPFNGHDAALMIETMIVWARAYLMTPWQAGEQ